MIARTASQPTRRRCRNGIAAGWLFALVLGWPAHGADGLPRAGGAIAEKYFSFGDDSGDYAHDGECDDPRFRGEGMAEHPFSPGTDASDCRNALAAGRVSVRPVYLPSHAAGAPYDTSGIDFGDDASQWAGDGECDDPRFEGPGVAATLIDDDLRADASDCRAAVEQGTAVLRDDAEHMRLRQAVDSRST